jgi:hypothetical protein
MPTETEMKLRDAETQCSLAVSNHGLDDTFRSCINALIAAGRSVTFVMQRESDDCPGLTAWYEARMSGMRTSTDAPLLKFFNDARVYTIHRGVIAPQRITAQIMDLKVNGVPQPENTGRTMFFYRFADIDEYMPGSSGNVLRLCDRYLSLLRGLVAEWLARRTELGSIT